MATKLNPLKGDPTRTGFLRRGFIADFNRRFNRLKRAIRALVDTEDAFGLKPKNNNPFVGNTDVLQTRVGNTSVLQTKVGNTDVLQTKVGNTQLVTNVPRWRFLAADAQLEAFSEWLKEKVNVELFEIVGEDRTWFEKYIDQSYVRGLGRAFDDVSKPATKENLEFFKGSREEFIRSAFHRPVSLERVKVLTSRNLNELKGLSDSMQKSIKRELVDGLVLRRSPLAVASRMLNIVEVVGKKRAKTIARTEIVRAHAEGSLIGLKDLGVESIGVMVEWVTAGDLRVCPQCKALEGVVLKPDEAEGMIPRHPNCRCAFIPANVGESTKGQTRSSSQIAKAIKQSISLQFPGSKKTFRSKADASRWAGVSKRISRKRPKPLL